MTHPDAVWARIGHGVELSQRGEREHGRQLLAELWEEVGADDNPLYRVALAHAMADLQDDPGEKLAWDLSAMRAADSVTDARAAQAGLCTPFAAFYPSLHLNLGEDHRRLGNLPAARHHLELGQAAATALGDDGYGQMIRSGLDRLAFRLADANAQSS